MNISANDINKAIDNAENIGESLLQKFIMSELVAKYAFLTMGFVGYFATVILELILEKLFFKALRLFLIKNPQYKIDVQEGKIQARKIKEAGVNGTDGEYANEIVNY